MTIDYLGCPIDVLAAALERNGDEFGVGDPVTAADILDRVGRNDAELVRFEHGVALVQRKVVGGHHLWLLFVDPDCRGRGLGRAYMKALLKDYASEYYMTLNCSVRLRPFYGRLGFRVLERDGDFRRMQGPYARGERLYR